MKIVIFDTAPLTFLGGFEGNIIDLGKYLSKTEDVSFITGNQFINNLWSLVSQGHLCEARVTKKYVNNRTGKLSITEYGFWSLIPIHPHYHAARRKMLKADLVYLKNEVFDILVVKYWLLFSKKTPAIVCGVHTPTIYPHTPSLKSKLHNLVYASNFYKKLIRRINIRFLTLNYADYDMIKSDTRNRVALIPNGIDTEIYSNKYCESDGKFKILFAGRLTEQKGVSVLVGAIQLLSVFDFFNTIEFCFAGTGELEHLVVDITKKYSNVKWLGHQTNMAKLYQKSDMVVAPSLYETFCFTVAEAQSCSRPVITTNIPGPKDIVIHNKTGLIIESNTSRELADAIIRMRSLSKENPKLFKQFGIDARQNIIDNFSIQKTVKLTKELFSLVISEQTANEKYNKQ